MSAVYVETRDVPLGKLNRFPGNARRGDVGKIRESIRRNGQYRSLVVRVHDETLTILAGNHTFDALRSERSETARCELIVCDDATARRINLVDNRAAELGTYDTDSLVELLSYLDGDYIGSGYTEDDVQNLINPPLPDPADTPTGDDQSSTWSVVITCRDEDEQADLLRRLTLDGLNVRAVKG